jgi:hypothetical protein
MLASFATTTPNGFLNGFIKLFKGIQYGGPISVPEPLKDLPLQLPPCLLQGTLNLLPASGEGHTHISPIRVILPSLPSLYQILGEEVINHARHGAFREAQRAAQFAHIRIAAQREGQQGMALAYRDPELGQAMLIAGFEAPHKRVQMALYCFADSADFVLLHTFLPSLKQSSLCLR